MSEDFIGAVFNDRYTITEKIGAGGMATVFKADDAKGSDPVAIKILSQQFLARNPKEAERNLRRFKREANILELLAGCPHVVGYIEHACSETGDWYIAMELLDGEQLRHYMGRGRTVMGIPTFLHLGVGLVQGLQEIHERNILHRDLAPDNVIVVKDAEGLLLPKYLDFGIGKSLGNDLDQVTQMLTIMGKPQYFSPEQARGLELTTASDAYSMGVVLYEMVTGYVPLEIHGYPDFRKILKEPPLPISNYREGCRIPPELQQVIMACLSKKPEERPTLDVLMAELERTRDRFRAGETFEAEGDADVTGVTAAATVTPGYEQPTGVDLNPGDNISRFEVKGLLGEGGMGAVYLAWDPVLHREVAIKVANKVSEEKAKKDVLREARASSPLRCANIVSIYDAGTEGGIPYIAMEYVKGRSLSQIIEEDGVITGDRFWHIARGICEGLRFAHEREQPVVHRDLKPGNMLLDRRDEVKITDFGIAKVMSGMTVKGDTAAHGGRSGTVATMSPEQANDKHVDTRSDIYSLGCVFYMMVTGRGPFQGNEIAILYQHCTAKPEAPSKRNPELQPKELDRIILKCLEKEPDDRYQSADEVLQDLRLLFEPSQVQAGPWYRSKVGISAAVAALVAIVAIVAMFMQSSTPDPGSLDIESIKVGERGNESVFRRGDEEDARLHWSGKPRVQLDFNAPSGAAVVKVWCRPEGGEWVPLPDLAVDPEFGVDLPVTLPVGPAETWKPRMAYELALGLEEWEEAQRFRFGVVFDGVPPRLQFRSSLGGDWVAVDPKAPATSGVVGTVFDFDPAAIEFRILDEGIGRLRPRFEGGEEHEGELIVNGANREDALSWVTREADGHNFIFTLHLQDVLGARASPRIRAVILDPKVSIEQHVAATNADALPLNVTLKDSRNPGAAEEIGRILGGLEGLTAYLENRPDASGPLRAGANGRFTGAIDLRQLKTESAAARTLAVRFRLEREGRPALELTPEAGQEELARFRLDAEAPRIRFHYLDEEGRARSIETGDGDDLEVRITQKQLREALGLRNEEQGLRIVIDDGAGGFAPATRLAVAYDGEALAPRNPVVGNERLFRLPEVPGGASEIDVVLAVNDAAGNEGNLKFLLVIEPSKIRTATLAQKGPNAADGVFHLQKADDANLALELTEPVPEEIEVLVVDAAGGTLNRVTARRAGDGNADETLTLDLAGKLGLAGGEGARRLVIKSRKGAGDTFKEVATYDVVVDSRPPTLVVASRVGTVEAPIVAGQEWARRPTVVVKALDAHLDPDSLEVVALRPDGTRLPVSALKALEDNGTRGAAVEIEGADDVANAADYLITVQARDLAGNAASPVEMRLQVVPPRIELMAVDGRAVGGFDFNSTKTAYVTREGKIELGFENRAVSGNYRIEARLSGSAAGAPQVLELSGARPKGTLVVSDLVSAGGESAGHVDVTVRQELSGYVAALRTLHFVVDRVEPDVTVLVDGKPFVKNGSFYDPATGQLADANAFPGGRRMLVSRLDQVVIEVSDEVGLDEDPLLPQGEFKTWAEKATRNVQDDRRRVSYTLAHDPSWAGEEIRVQLRARDRVGNQNIEFRSFAISKILDSPTLLGVSAGGKDLVEVGGDDAGRRWRSDALAIAVRFSTESVPGVESISASLQRADTGEQIGSTLLRRAAGSSHEFTGELRLRVPPGEAALFVLRCSCRKKGDPEAGEFFERRIVYDQSPPVLELFAGDRSLEPGAEITIKRTTEISVRGRDLSFSPRGSGGVSALIRDGGQQRSVDLQREGDGADGAWTWRMPALADLVNDPVTVEFRARDDLGNATPEPTVLKLRFERWAMGEALANRLPALAEALTRAGAADLSVQERELTGLSQDFEKQRSDALATGLRESADALRYRQRLEEARAFLALRRSLGRDPRSDLSTLASARRFTPPFEAWVNSERNRLQPLVPLDLGTARRVYNEVVSGASPTGIIDAAGLMRRLDAEVSDVGARKQAKENGGGQVSADVTDFLRRAGALRRFLDARARSATPPTDAQRAQFRTLAGDSDLHPTLQSTARRLGSAVEVTTPQPVALSAEGIQRRLGEVGLGNIRPMPVTSDPRDTGRNPPTGQVRFWMSETEVTYSQLKVFLDRMANSQELDALIDVLKQPSSRNPGRKRFSNSNARSLRRDLQRLRGKSGNRPVDRVSSRVAGAFCVWVGGSLPTVAEWRYAAGSAVSGASQIVRWDKDGNRAYRNPSYKRKDGWAIFNRSDSESVRNLKAHGLFGLLGMPGNVAEWCLEDAAASDWPKRLAILGGSFKDRDAADFCDLDLPPPTKGAATRVEGIGFRVLWPKENR